MKSLYQKSKINIKINGKLDESKKIPPPQVTIKIDESEIPMHSARVDHVLFEETKKQIGSITCRGESLLKKSGI